jgi:hypothetical protein
MILCTSCNRENDDNASVCGCGEPLLKYNFCGVPVLGGSSRGQVLAMRYIIEQQLEENNASCTYKAEDAADNTSVLIRTLPVSVPLNPEQIEHLKESAKTVASLSPQYINGLKAFEVSGNIRFFVFEYSQNEAAYENTMKQLKIQAVVNEEQYTAELNNANEIIENITEEKEILLQQIRGNEESLEKVKTEADQQQQKHSQELDKAQWKIGALSSEIEKLIKKNKKKTDATHKTNFRLSAAIFVLTSGIILGTAGNYLFLKYKRQGKDFLNKWTAKEIHNSADSQQYAADANKEEAVQIVSHNLSPSDANNAEMMFELGLMYYSGRDTEQDYDKALKYFTESAQAGNALAMYNTGRMYQDGSGVEADGVKAVQWYEKAAQAGLTKAMNQLAQMYYMGDIVQQDYEKAVEYYELSAKKDDSNAMYNLAILYHAGIGVEKDVSKAMLWFIKAARQGDADSMYQLGTLFENGNGIEKDAEKAAYWYQTAADAGQEQAKTQLAKLSKNQTITPQN